MMMEWSDLKVFLAVARAGTLGGAARLTGQTQPTMGRRLRALEAALGQRLFQRGSAGFVLTEEGLAMRAHAERIEEETLAIERRMAGAQAGLGGLLRLSSSDWFGLHVLAPICAAFMKQHPDVTIELLTDARLLSAARREADLLFRITPFREPEVVQRRFMALDYGLYVSNRQRAALPRRGRGLRLLTMDSAFEELPDVAWLKNSFPEGRVVFGSNSREAQARLCAAGAGVAVLPDALARALPGLRRVERPQDPPGREVWVGYHEDLRYSARLRAFLEFALARVGEDG
ncbi:LysR family transcriptional regulator [Pelomonas sp. KK5]|uniref:LysR family transcriptional regulator n=1 Tax=Pelomonas sp. KK5 TaxID=1855730 RepID=UPI0035140A1B